jgi:hypothetical protein
LIDQILTYDGQNGMRGFLSRYENQAVFISIEDPFIRLDADTEGDLFVLREKYSQYGSR